VATVGGMVVYLTLNTMGLSKGLAKAQAELAAFQAQRAGTATSTGKANEFATLAAGARVAGLAILGIGVASAVAATRFEYEMKLIRTQAGATTYEVERMSDAVLNMAPDVLTGPQRLSQALFIIESVGLRGRDAMEALRLSAQGAAVGNADLLKVTNALLAVQISGIKGTTGLADAMGVLNGIVGTGNLEMQGLTSSLSSGVLSTFKQFGLSLQDFGAAMSTMSDQAIPAEEASTRLRITIALLGAPTKIAERELNKIGLTGRSLADAMRGPGGLIGALTLLRDHMQGAGLDIVEQGQLLKTAFGGSRSSSGILTLLNSLDLMAEKYDLIGEKSKTFPDDFAIASQTAQAKLDALKAALEVLAIRLGNIFLPIIKVVATWLTKLADNDEVLVAGLLFLTTVVTAYVTKAFINFTVSLAQATLSIVQMIPGVTTLAMKIFALVAPNQAAAYATNQRIVATIMAAAATQRAAAESAAAAAKEAAAAQAAATARTRAAASAMAADNAARRARQAAARLDEQEAVGRIRAQSAELAAQNRLAATQANAARMAARAAAQQTAAATATAQANTAAATAATAAAAAQTQAGAAATAAGAASVAASEATAAAAAQSAATVVASQAAIRAALLQTLYTQLSTYAAEQAAFESMGMRLAQLLQMRLAAITIAEQQAAAQIAADQAMVVSAELVWRAQTRDARGRFGPMVEYRAVMLSAAEATADTAAVVETSMALMTRAIETNAVVVSQWATAYQLAMAAASSATMRAGTQIAGTMRATALLGSGAQTATHWISASEAALNGQAAAAARARPVFEAAGEAAEGMAQRAASSNQTFTQMAGRLGAGIMAGLSGLLGWVNSLLGTIIRVAWGAITAIIGAFTSLPAAVVIAIGAIVVSILAFDWPNQLAKAGGDMAHGIIKGLLDGLATMTRNVIDWIGDIFNSPEARDAAIQAGLDFAGGVMEGINRLNPFNWANTFMTHAMGNATASEIDRMNAQIKEIQSMLGPGKNQGVFTELWQNSGSSVEMTAKVDQIMQGMKKAYEHGGVEEANAFMSSFVENLEGGKSVEDAGKSATESYANGAAGAVQQVEPIVEQSLFELWGGTMVGVQNAAMGAGAKAMREYAKAIIDAQGLTKDAWNTLLEVQKTALAPGEDIARSIGMLQSKELIDALNSETPAVAAAAEALKKTIIENLDSLTYGAYSAGQNAFDGYAEGFRDRLAQVPFPKWEPDSNSWDISETGPQVRNLFTTPIGEGAPKYDPSIARTNRDLQDQEAAYRSLAAMWDSNFKPTAEQVTMAMQHLRESVSTGAQSVSQAVDEFFQKFGTENINAIAEAGKTMGAEFMFGVAQGIQSSREKVTSALSNLHTMLKDNDGWDQSRRVGFLQAQLMGADIAAGLASTDPVIRAQAEATRMAINAQIKAIREGVAAAAYAAEYAKNIADGMFPLFAQIKASIASTQALIQFDAGINLEQGNLDYLDWLKKMDEQAQTTGRSLSDMAGDAKAALTTAFDAIKAKAEDYFRSVHDKNLQAIADLRDQKNAILDAKMAREQRPIDRAQSALNWRLKEQEEARLRLAVQQATDPQSRMEAMQALRNFLDQRHIDEMQDEADKAKTILEREKEKNNKLYDEQVEAENRRYERQKKDFARQLSALKRFLEHHPEMWASAQERIISLLGSYGVGYTAMGDMLGGNLAAAMNKRIQTILDNLKKLWNATNPDKTGAQQDTEGHWEEYTLPNGDGGVRWVPGATAQRTTTRNRGVTDASASSTRRLQTVDASRDANVGANRNGGGTIVVQIGSERIGEVTDRALYVQESIYGRDRTLTTGGGGSSTR